MTMPLALDDFDCVDYFYPSVPAKVMNQHGLSLIMAFSTTRQTLVQEQHTFRI